MGVDAAGRRRQAGLERRVHPAQRLPVRLQVADRLEREPGVVLGVCRRRDDGRERGLAGGAGHRRRGAVDRVRAGVPGGHVGRQLPTRGVVGVHVHRQIEARLQRRHQFCRRGRPEQAGHVLDGQHMRAGVDDLVGELEPVVQRVDLLARVGQVAGVGHRDFSYRRTGFTHRLDRGAHRGHIVQRVEDAEDVDTGRRGLFDERRRHQFRVRRVADGVAAAQQHLQTDVGQRLAQCGQALPRVFLQKAKAHIVSGAAPALDREQLRGRPGDVRGDLQQAGGPHAGGQQRLVCIAEGGVGDPDGRGVAQPAREAFRSQLDQPLLRPGRRRRLEVDGGQLVARVHRRRTRPVRLVDRHVGQVVEDLGAAVGTAARGQQLRTLVDERRGHLAGDEVGVVQHRLQERDVRRDAADSELGQGPLGASHRSGQIPSATGQFDQHGVEVRRYLGTQVGAAVEPDAGATRGAVRGDPAGVRAETVGRVLGGDAALQRRATRLHGLLAQSQLLERPAGGDTQL